MNSNTIIHQGRGASPLPAMLATLDPRDRAPPIAGETTCTEHATCSGNGSADGKEAGAILDAFRPFAPCDSFELRAMPDMPAGLRQRTGASPKHAQWISPGIPNLKNSVHSIAPVGSNGKFCQLEFDFQPAPLSAPKPNTFPAHRIFSQTVKEPA